VDNIVDLILKAKPDLETLHTYDAEAHHAVARKAAEESMVLLKNEDGILPLKAEQKIALIGELAVNPRYQGAGTSIVNPTKLDNAHDELKKLGVKLDFAKGYEKHSDEMDPVLIQEAVAAAKQADVAVIFAGLTEEYEAEGYDRENMDLPENHNYLIEAVAQVNPNVVVVLVGGSVVEMRWLNKVKAVLNSGLGGQAGGSAAANLLTGKRNPSGKTSETYPLSFKDNPTYGNYPGNSVTSEHRESVYIGYRYYDTAKKKWVTVVKATKERKVTIKSLKKGTKYTFSVKPYITTESGTVWVEAGTKIKTATKTSTPTLKVTSPSKGAASASWTNVSGETGYQVYYSTKKSSGYKKLGTYKANKVKATKSGLTRGKTYYFKVRAYIKTDSGTVYSAYSPVKSVKIK